MLSKAKRFAHLAHAGQMYGKSPYTKHLQAVATTLVKFGHNSLELRTAAWLHDIVEDTTVTIDIIENDFGRKVADLVWAVTNEKGGKNRKERHAITYPKIKRTPQAVILKLADRIANVTQSVKDQDPLLGMYRSEYKDFKDALYVPGQVEEPMWKHLDTLIGEK